MPPFELALSSTKLLVVLACSADTEWSLQDLSTSCWALARLSVGNRKLLDLIYNRILVDIPILSAKDISYQLWGFAALGYPLQSNVLNVYLVSNLPRSYPVANACVISAITYAAAGNVIMQKHPTWMIITGSDTCICA